jgi:hypothetical protein
VLALAFAGKHRWRFNTVMPHTSSSSPEAASGIFPSSDESSLSVSGHVLGKDDRWLERADDDWENAHPVDVWDLAEEVEDAPFGLKADEFRWHSGAGVLMLVIDSHMVTVLSWDQFSTTQKKDLSRQGVLNEDRPD